MHKTELKVNTILPKYEIIGGNLSSSIQISYYKSLQRFEVSLVSLCGKESACSSGDLGSISGLGRSPGEGNGKPLQCSCLENPMDRGAWQATVHKVTKSRTTSPLSLKASFAKMWSASCHLLSCTAFSEWILLMPPDRKVSKEPMDC